MLFKTIMLLNVKIFSQKNRGISYSCNDYSYYRFGFNNQCSNINPTLKWIRRFFVRVEKITLTTRWYCSNSYICYLLVFEKHFSCDPSKSSIQIQFSAIHRELLICFVDRLWCAISNLRWHLDVELTALPLQLMDRCSLILITVSELMEYYSAVRADSKQLFDRSRKTTKLWIASRLMRNIFG